MALIEMKLLGLDKVTRRLTKVLPDEVRKELALEIRSYAKQVLTAASLNLPRRTGATAAQLKIRSKNRGLNAYIGVFGDRGYIARFLEFGTKPHSVRGGADLSRKKRQSGKLHPGIKATGWLLEKTLPMRQQFQQRVAIALREAVRKATRS